MNIRALAPFARWTPRTAIAAALLTACAGGTPKQSSDGGPFYQPDGGAGGTPGFPPTGGTPDVPGGNRRPELKRIGDREAEVGSALTIQLEGSDPDGDTVAFNVRSSLPDGAKFEKDKGRFSWTPDVTQQGTIVLLTFEVSDGTLRDQETIQISVVAPGAGTGGAPVLDPVGDQSLVAGHPFALQLQATDPQGDKLTYTMRGAEGLQGATLDASTGAFNWTPDAAMAGQQFKVTFAVSDGEHETTEAVNLVVRAEGEPGGQDLPPRITPIEDREVKVGETVDIVVQADDEHPELLTYELVTTPPEGASFDAPHGHLVWTPSAAQANQAFRLVFRVSDGTFRAVETVTLTVVDAGGGDGACTPDTGEPNADERAPLTPETPVTASICQAGDADSYIFHADAGQRFQIDCTFAHALGDIDLGVAGPEGTDFVLVSDSSDDDESVTGTAPVAGDYYVLVAGYDGATNPNYSLMLHMLAAGPSDCTDPAEGPGGNNDAAHTAPLRDHLGETLHICAGDDDFFSVELAAGQHVTLTAAFSHANGDLDAELTGPDGFLRTSGSADDDEGFDLNPVPVAGTYVLHVFGYAGAENDYTLALTEAAATPCTDDRVEPNDARADAEPFPAQVYNNLTWCGDPDWYKTQTQNDEALQVYLSYDGALSPTIEAYDAAGTPIVNTEWEIANGDGCHATRSACRRLTVRPAAAGWVYWQVLDGTRGMAYDVTVRAVAGGAGAQCSLANETCGDFQVCDYPSGQCVASYCDDSFACPGDYLCHENWCVSLCQDDGTCSYAGFNCKMLDGLDTCGLAGDSNLGDPCFDFTDCSGALDCLNDAAVPGGYCSRSCVADAECGAGACVNFGTGNFCGARCARDADCRDGYICGSHPGQGGAVVHVCEPAP